MPQLDPASAGYLAWKAIKAGETPSSKELAQAGVWDAMVLNEWREDNLGPPQSADAAYWILYWPALDYIERQSPKLDVHHSVIDSAKMLVQSIARRVAEQDFVGVGGAEGQAAVADAWETGGDAVASGMVGH